MATTPQSVLQTMVQNTAGTHTAGQSNVPSAANTGNPGTPYNWSSYVPIVTNPNTANPSVAFNLITSQAAPSSAGYTPPFTADPFAAMVLAGMPRAGASGYSNLLSNWMAGPGGGFTPNPAPGGGVPTGPGTGQPGTGGPPVPGGNRPGPGVATPGIPAGPISGPYYNNMHDWQGNYNNANPSIPTNPFGNWYGTPGSQGPTGYGSFDRLRNSLNGLMSSVGGNGQSGSSGTGNGLTNWLRGQWNEFKQELGQMGRDISGQNGWKGFLRILGTVQGIPSEISTRLLNMDNMTPQQRESFVNEIDGYLEQGLNSMNADQRNQFAQQMQQQLQADMRAMGQEAARAIAQQQNGGRPATQSQINQILSGLLSGAGGAAVGAGAGQAGLRAWYNAQPEMSQREWDNLQRHFDFVNMFQTPGAGSDWMQSQMDANTRRIYQIFGGRSFREY